MNIHTKKHLILDTIFKSEKNITAFEISEKVGLSLSATKSLLRELDINGYIWRIKEGILCYYRYLTPKGIKLYNELQKALETS